MGCSHWTIRLKWDQAVEYDFSERKQFECDVARLVDSPEHLHDEVDEDASEEHGFHHPKEVWSLLKVEQEELSNPLNEKECIQSQEQTLHSWKLLWMK